MAKSKKKTSEFESNETQLQLLYGEQSAFKYWESHLFNEVYLRRDLPEKYADKWNDVHSGQFELFEKVIRDLANEYKNREKELLNWSETETINNWVKYVLEGLGWKNNCTGGVQNPFLEETSFRYDSKTYRTDILIVDHPKEKKYVNEAKGDDKLKEARTTVLVPVEVKYWQRLEEFRQGKNEEKGRRDTEVDDLDKIATPNEQTVQYMNILKKNWGILTDGAKWRLFNLDLSGEDSNRYYEFNLYSLIEAINTATSEQDRAEVVTASKYFFHFFSKESFPSSNNSAECFLDEILSFSKKYVTKVEEDLKDRFVKAMNIACNGFYKSAASSKMETDLQVIRNVSESTLFNILFIKSLEARGVLPMSSTDYKKISLSNTIDKIERFDPDKDDILNHRELERSFRKGNGNSFNYSPSGTELHDRILRLTMVIHEGSTKDSFGFEISGFKESIFSSDEWAFFKNAKIKNDDWVKILFQLGYADSDSLNRKYQQIPYSFFTPRQLGSIYESFLEFTLEIADVDMVFFKRQWQKADLKSKKLSDTKLPTVRKNELFFTPNNKDRKATGSFYTPDAVVQYVVNETLQPLVKGKKVEDILKLKVCDPSMGSGHFLVSALNHLAKAVVTSNNLLFDSDKSVSIESARREILDKCIFGVDINPRSVKLAKMSLWLESAQINCKLENLDDQIKCGDSLIKKSQKYPMGFSWEDEFFAKKNFKGFDALVGNPPWDKIKPNDLDFFRQYSPTYGMGGKQNTKEKEALLKNPKIQKAYEEYQNLNSEMLEYFKSSKDYSFQVVEVEGKKTGGDANKYRLFCEKYFRILEKSGRIGIVLPHSVLSDTGATGVRKLFLENLGLEKVIGFVNEFNGREFFPGVAKNVKIVCLVLNGKGTTKNYKSKFVENPYAIRSEELVTIDRSIFANFSGENYDIFCFRDEQSYKINASLSGLEKFGTCGEISNLVVKSGEADMTLAKKYFSEKVTPYKLVTGRNFTSFTKIYDVDTYLHPDFVENRPDSNEPRILLKAIMPDSIKKVQATWAPKNNVASNNLFAVKLGVDSHYSQAILGLLNSDLIEFRIRSVLSNFRLLHRHVYDVPVSGSILAKLIALGIEDVVEKMSGTAETNPKLMKKLNDIVYSAYKINKTDQNYISRFIYENKESSDADEDDSELAS